MGFSRRAVAVGIAAVAAVSGFGAAPAAATAATVSLVGAVSRNDSASNGEGEVLYSIPAGVRVGDLLVLQISIDGQPIITQRNGFTKIAHSQSIGLGEKTYTLYKLLTAANIGPGNGRTYTTGVLFVDRSGLRAATAVAAFRGEDTVAPILSPEATSTDSTYRHRTISVGGVPRVVAGAMLVAGIGADEGSVLPSSIPAGFTVAAASAPGQVAEIVTRPLATAPVGGLSAAAVFGFPTGRTYGMAAYQFAIAPAR